MLCEKLQLLRLTYRLVWLLPRLLSAVVVEERLVLALREAPKPHLLLAVLADLVLAPLDRRPPCLVPIKARQQTQSSLLASVARHPL